MEKTKMWRVEILASNGSKHFYVTNAPRITGAILSISHEFRKKFPKLDIIEVKAKIVPLSILKL